MSCLITALTRSHTINKTTGEKNKQQNAQKEKRTYSTAKIQNLNLKATSNNVKIQSEETLTTQTYFFVTTKKMRLYNNVTRQQVDKKKR